MNESRHMHYFCFLNVKILKYRLKLYLWAGKDSEAQCLCRLQNAT